jgi:hypothetical protein
MSSLMVATIRTIASPAGCFASRSYLHTVLSVTYKSGKHTSTHTDNTRRALDRAPGNTEKVKASYGCCKRAHLRVPVVDGKTHPRWGARASCYGAGEDLVLVDCGVFCHSDHHVCVGLPAAPRSHHRTVQLYSQCVDSCEARQLSVISVTSMRMRYFGLRPQWRRS